MTIETRQHIYFAFLGLAMGYCLERIGFGDFGEVHRLFVFEDVRMLFTFMGAVVIAMLGFFVIARGQAITSRPYHKGSIVGGILFGVGWAITGACPSAVMIYIGAGHLAAVATIAGMFAGMLIYNKLKPRYFRWSTGGCE